MSQIEFSTISYFKILIQCINYLLLEKKKLIPTVKYVELKEYSVTKHIFKLIKLCYDSQRL